MLGARSRGFCRGGLLTDAFLLMVFLILAFIFIQRRGYMNKVHSQLDDIGAISDTGQMHGVEQVRNTIKLRKIDIDERIRKIPDARSAQCQSHSYQEDQPVSIIITFYDYQFYDLKTTVASVLHNTPHNLITEIIIVDDGSTLDYIHNESTAYADKISLVRLLRIASSVGQARARMHAVAKSKSEFLVFLDTNVICNAGWLPPLTELLRKEHMAIAVPHFDNINNPISYEYTKTDWELLTTFSWSFTIRMSPSHVTSKDHIAPFIKSPTLRGNAYAVRKKFLQRLGGFDEAMKDTGAESLELSLRTWMCGGVIKILPCSRVGVLHLKDPIKIIMSENIRRIVAMWMPEKKEFIYKHTGLTGNMDKIAADSVDRRKKELSELRCENFDWYQRNVIPDIYTPSMDAVSYGLLRCKSGRCARSGTDLRIDLGQCKPDQYQLHSKEMIFEHTRAGTIMTGGKCLMVLPTAYVMLEECRKGETKQTWELKPNGVLRNIWSNYCAMHVTDPDKKVPKNRQIMMVQECPGDAAGMFVEFEFILP